MFQEVKPGVTNQIPREKFTCTVLDSIVDFMAGDIIVFQEDVGNNPNAFEKPTAANYFKFV